MPAMLALAQRLDGFGTTGAAAAAGQAPNARIADRA
jgi:hypothetical protein